MTEKRTHTSDCDWHVDQYPWECTCGFIPRKKAMDDLIAQDADLISKLRDEDSYYRLQEKHWCIDAEELERQRLAAADRIEALEAENERLREALERIHELETALAPFASHIGKVDAPVVLAIGSDTWTGTLTGQDFANAARAYNKCNPEYLKWLALKENTNGRSDSTGN